MHTYLLLEVHTCLFYSIKREAEENNLRKRIPSIVVLINMLGFIVDFVKSIAGGLLGKKGPTNPGVVKIKIEQQEDAIVSNEKSVTATATATATTTTKVQGSSLDDIEAVKAAAKRKLQMATTTAAKMKKKNAAAKKKQTVVKNKLVRTAAATAAATAARKKRAEEKKKRKRKATMTMTMAVNKKNHKAVDIINTEEIQSQMLGTKRTRKPPVRFCDSDDSTGKDKSKIEEKPAVEVEPVKKKKKVGWPKGKPRKKVPNGKPLEKIPKRKAGWPKGKPRKIQKVGWPKGKPRKKESEILTVEEARLKKIANKKRTAAAIAARLKKAAERRKIKELEAVAERRKEKEAEIEAKALTEKVAEEEGGNDTDTDTDTNTPTGTKTKRKRKPPVRFCDSNESTGMTDKNDKSPEISEEARLQKTANKKRTAAATAARLKKAAERKKMKELEAVAERRKELETEADVEAKPEKEVEAKAGKMEGSAVSKKKRKLEHEKETDPTEISTATANSNTTNDGKTTSKPDTAGAVASSPSIATASSNLMDNGKALGVTTSSPVKNVSTDQAPPNKISPASNATPQQKQEDQQWLNYLNSHRFVTPNWRNVPMSSRQQIPTNTPTPIVNGHTYSTTPVQNTLWYPQTQQPVVPWSNPNQARYAPQPAYPPNMNQHYPYMLSIPPNGPFPSREQIALQQPVATTTKPNDSKDINATKTVKKIPATKVESSQKSSAKKETAAKDHKAT